MKYFIRNLRFKYTIFRNTYLLFDFWLGDKWRKGKISLNLSPDKFLSIAEVSSQIINYIDTFCEKRKNFWTIQQRKGMAEIIEQFNRKQMEGITILFK